MLLARRRGIQTPLQLSSDTDLLARLNDFRFPLHRISRKLVEVLRRVISSVPGLNSVMPYNNKARQLIRPPRLDLA